MRLVFDHSLQELELKLKGRGLSVLLFTVELNEIGAKRKRFFFILCVLIFY